MKRFDFGKNLNDSEINNSDQPIQMSLLAIILMLTTTMTTVIGLCTYKKRKKQTSDDDYSDEGEENQIDIEAGEGEGEGEGEEDEAMIEQGDVLEEADVMEGYDEQADVNQEGYGEQADVNEEGYGEQADVNEEGYGEQADVLPSDAEQVPVIDSGAKQAPDSEVKAEPPLSVVDAIPTNGKEQLPLIAKISAFKFSDKEQQQQSQQKEPIIKTKIKDKDEQKQQQQQKQRSSSRTKLNISIKKKETLTDEALTGEHKTSRLSEETLTLTEKPAIKLRISNKLLLLKQGQLPLSQIHDQKRINISSIRMLRTTGSKIRNKKKLQIMAAKKEYIQMYAGIDELQPTTITKKRQQPSISSKKQTLSMSRTMSPAKTRSTMMTMKTTSPGGHTLDFIEPKTIKTKDSTEMINIKVKMSPISKMLSTAVRQNTKFMMKNKKTKLTTPTMDDQKTISKTMDRKTINITINQQQQPTKMKIIRKKDMIRWIAGMKTPKTSSSSPKTSSSPKRQETIRSFDMKTLLEKLLRKMNLWPKTTIQSITKTKTEKMPSTLKTMKRSPTTSRKSSWIRRRKRSSIERIPTKERSPKDRIMKRRRIRSTTERISSRSPSRTTQQTIRVSEALLVPQGLKLKLMRQKVKRSPELYYNDDYLIEQQQQQPQYQQQQQRYRRQSPPRSPPLPVSTVIRTKYMPKMPTWWNNRIKMIAKNQPKWSSPLKEPIWKIGKSKSPRIKIPTPYVSPR
ncbi:hypothetical protein DERP_003749 [Dermatophagoides pteronyssinus]|uniref:Uncharacterized protein n=1 Tax=Dermatophagoides pteronyssinus TaxID=6956 RepID=A0ABQ8JLH5_DERPT|nr:hypothetical protein DERP_003749 [Dermatophagoides pteronyssinus]